MTEVFKTCAEALLESSPAGGLSARCNTFAFLFRDHETTTACVLWEMTHATCQEVKAEANAVQHVPESCLPLYVGHVEQCLGHFYGNAGGELNLSGG